MDQRVKRLMEIYVNDINNFFYLMERCQSWKQRRRLVPVDLRVRKPCWLSEINLWECKYDKSWSWMMPSITLQEVQVNDIGR